MSVLRLVLANTDATVVSRDKSACQPSKARYRTDAGALAEGAGVDPQGCCGDAPIRRSLSETSRLEVPFVLHCLDECLKRRYEDLFNRWKVLPALFLFV